MLKKTPHLTLPTRPWPQPRALLSALLLTLPLSACLEDLPDPTLVEDTRILGIQLSPPELSPGDSVTAQLIVANPEAEPLQIRWSLCLHPDPSFAGMGGSNEMMSSGGKGTSAAVGSASRSCFSHLQAELPFAQDLGEGSAVSFEISEDFFADDLAFQQAYPLPSPNVLPEAFRDLFLGLVGVNLSLEVEVDTPARTLVATKLLKVSKPQPLPGHSANENPQPLILDWGTSGTQGRPTTQAGSDASQTACFGSPPELRAGKAYRLSPYNAPEARPTYLTLLLSFDTEEPFSVESRTETYFYSWFTTVGTFEKRVTKFPSAPANHLTIPEDAPDTLDLWVLLRNGRGGLDFCHETLPIAPAR